MSSTAAPVGSKGFLDPLLKVKKQLEEQLLDELVCVSGIDNQTGSWRRKIKILDEEQRPTRCIGYAVLTCIMNLFLYNDHFHVNNNGLDVELLLLLAVFLLSTLLPLFLGIECMLAGWHSFDRAEALVRDYHRMTDPASVSEEVHLASADMQEVLKHSTTCLRWWFKAEYVLVPLHFALGLAGKAALSTPVQIPFWYCNFIMQWRLADIFDMIFPSKIRVKGRNNRLKKAIAASPNWALLHSSAAFVGGAMHTMLIDEYNVQCTQCYAHNAHNVGGQFSSSNEHVCPALFLFALFLVAMVLNLYVQLTHLNKYPDDPARNHAEGCDATNLSFAGAVVEYVDGGFVTKETKAAITMQVQPFWIIIKLIVFCYMILSRRIQDPSALVQATFMFLLTWHNVLPVVHQRFQYLATQDLAFGWSTVGYALCMMFIVAVLEIWAVITVLVLSDVTRYAFLWFLFVTEAFIVVVPVALFCYWTVTINFMRPAMLFLTVMIVPVAIILVI